MSSWQSELLQVLCLAMPHAHIEAGLLSRCGCRAYKVRAHPAFSSPEGQASYRPLEIKQA
jgi:hypothetical protein